MSVGHNQRLRPEQTCNSVSCVAVVWMSAHDRNNMSVELFVISEPNILVLSGKPLHFSLQYTSLYEGSMTLPGLQTGNSVALWVSHSLLITIIAEKLLLQCDSEPVKAAATEKQPVLNLTIV